jgi:UDP-N-acetylglucosamine:LPS N-acetylglucosamine transferase
MNGRRPKVLAISSGGGHWVQLLRLNPAFEGCEVLYATVHKAYQGSFSDDEFFVIPDGNSWNKFKLIFSFLGIFRLIISVKPDCVVSTGAAPGYFAIMIMKLLGGKTVWIDSIANAEQLSKSGLHAQSFADLWLTQWPHLQKSDGPKYMGKVL